MKRELMCGLISLFAGMLIACEGPQGIQGLSGTQGIAGIQGPPGSEPQECTSPPPVTYEMGLALAKAETYFMSCSGDTYSTYNYCLKMANGNLMEEEACFNEWIKADEVCFFFYAKMLNKMPYRECGVKLFEAVYTYDPNTMVETYTTTFLGNTADFDSDGIADWWETWMGLNPCTANTYGSCIEDGDLDYDDDGIPNAQDEKPICNELDPEEYLPDCY